jgi:chromosome segregation ATPase
MSKAKAEADTGDQSIERLQSRYHDLHTKKIQADTNLENATGNPAALKEEACEKFGTDDVDELRSKLDAMKAENEEKRKNYQAELDRIESELKAVERQFADAEGAPGETS